MMPPTTSNRSSSVADLIRVARESPPKPGVAGLLNENEILLLHGSEESFKTVFVVQLAACIATGEPFLRLFPVDHPRHVGIMETEMHAAQMGLRLAKMFGETPPIMDKLRFMNDSMLRQFRSEKNLDRKIGMVHGWVLSEHVSVLMIDTANDFFRGEENPSDERHVGLLFDRLRSMCLAGYVLVRHDRKRRGGDDSAISFNDNEEIRGSAEWKEDPEAIVSLQRVDRRTHKVVFNVGKLRYGRKPESMVLWLDAGTFQLTPLPPAIAVLEAGPLARRELVRYCDTRFGLSERATDDMVKKLKPFLRETQRGHEKVFEIDRNRLVDEPWGKSVRLPPEIR